MESDLQRPKYLRNCWTRKSDAETLHRQSKPDEINHDHVELLAHLQERHGAVEVPEVKPPGMAVWDRIPRPWKSLDTQNYLATAPTPIRPDLRVLEQTTKKSIVATT